MLAGVIRQVMSQLPIYGSLNSLCLLARLGLWEFKESPSPKGIYIPEKRHSTGVQLLTSGWKKGTVLPTVP